MNTMAKHEPLFPITVICQECCVEQTIIRRESRLKEKGHKKHMYCHVCDAKTLHLEKKYKV